MGRRGIGRVGVVVAAVLAAIVGAIFAGSAAAGEPPAKVAAPDFERVDFAHPENYTSIDYDVGDRARVVRIARALKKDDAEATLKAIHEWIAANLRYQDAAAYSWRTCSKIVSDGTLGGCADDAELFGTLARACGIPTVWVKTMDATWIRDAVDGSSGAEKEWSGHVFLEVHVDGRWALLDAAQGLLLRDHDVRTRIYPGGRWAYDRGGDPYAVVLSVRWEEWKEQTRRHFAGFDVARLPALPPQPLGAGRRRVLGCANRPVWAWIEARAKEAGREVVTANSGLRARAAWAAGGTVVVTDVGEEFCGPGASFREATGLTVEAIRAERRAKGGAARLERRAADGTRWVVLTAEDAGRMRPLVDALGFE